MCVCEGSEVMYSYSSPFGEDVETRLQASLYHGTFWSGCVCVVYFHSDETCVLINKGLICVVLICATGLCLLCGGWHYYPDVSSGPQS